MTGRDAKRAGIAGSLLLILVPPGWAATGPRFNILDYGASNDGSAPSTEAFRAAIQAAKAAGGGTVFVPAGKYVTRTHRTGEQPDALFRCRRRWCSFPPQRLPFTEGRQQSIEALTPVPLIGGTQSGERHHHGPRACSRATTPSG